MEARGWVRIQRREGEVRQGPECIVKVRMGWSGIGFSEESTEVRGGLGCSLGSEGWIRI